MAIDQTRKALNMASKTIDAVQKFMEAIEALQALEKERSGAGLTLTNYDAAFAADDSSIKHVDGTILNGVLNTSIPAIATFMADNNHDDNLNKARP